MYPLCAQIPIDYVSIISIQREIKIKLIKRTQTNRAAELVMYKEILEIIIRVQIDQKNRV